MDFFISTIFRKQFNQQQKMSEFSARLPHPPAKQGVSLLRIITTGYSVLINKTILKYAFFLTFSVVLALFTSHTYDVSKAAGFETFYECKVKNMKTMEKVKKVYFSDVSSAPLPRNVVPRKQ
jgi:hypothetical protein